jgi:transcriptional regulator with XRE-family HTH domain
MHETLASWAALQQPLTALRFHGRDPTVCAMSETRSTLTHPASGDARVVLNEKLFLARTRALGASNDRERCAVAGISRASLHRWRRGDVVPSFAALRGVAKKLDVKLDQLVREVAT